MQTSCRRCVEELRGAAARLFGLETAPCVFIGGVGSRGIATQHLSKRDYSSSPADGFKIPTTDDWEEFVAQCRKAGRDAQPQDHDALQLSQPEAGTVKQAPAKAIKFSAPEGLDNLGDAPLDAAPASSEPDVWSGGPKDLVPAKRRQTSEAFSAPVFPGEAHIRNRSSTSSSSACRVHAVVKCLLIVISACSACSALS